jgi:hypothetical protein
MDKRFFALSAFLILMAATGIDAADFTFEHIGPIVEHYKTK